jgi:hypothetical protein
MDRDKWFTSRTDRLTPGEIKPVSTEYEGKWASEPVWTVSRREIFRTPAEIRKPYQALSKGEENIFISQGNRTKNEMGGACRAYGGEERRIHGFGRET